MSTPLLFALIGGLAGVLLLQQLGLFKVLSRQYRMYRHRQRRKIRRKNRHEEPVLK